MMVGPMRPNPSELAMGGASTRAISSQNRACCISVALRPPYSFGHETAAQRPSWSFCCQARRYGNDSSMGFSRHSFRSEEHTSELQSHLNLVCRLLLEKKKQIKQQTTSHLARYIVNALG